MNKKKYFEIGCFHFSLKNREENIDCNDYKKNIEQCLSSISNITNLKIEFGVKRSNKEVTLDYTALINDPITRKDNTFFPIPYFGQIIFDLKVPFEFQISIWPILHLINEKIENFRVRIIYDGILPIAFIMPLDFSDKYHLHSIVMVVREYLKTLINSKDNCLIEFVILGPSPLHVNCYLEPSEGINNSPGWEFYDNQDKVPNEIIFDYSTTYFNNYEDNQDYLESVSDSIFRYISKEVALYYKIEQMINLRNKMWRNIDGYIAQLRDSQKQCYFKKLKINTIILPKIINNLFLELVEFQSDWITYSYYLDNLFKAYNDTKSLQPFNGIINKIHEDYLSKKFPVEEVHQLINFYEQRTTNTWIIIAGFAGVLLGAILTKAFGG